MFHRDICCVQKSSFIATSGPEQTEVIHFLLAVICQYDSDIKNTFKLCFTWKECRKKISTGVCTVPERQFEATICYNNNKNNNSSFFTLNFSGNESDIIHVSHGKCKKQAKDKQHCFALVFRNESTAQGQTFQLFHGVHQGLARGGSSYLGPLFPLHNRKLL